MTQPQGRPADPDSLRRQAEKRARADEARAEQTLSPEETRQVLHELRVHQIELEMQNEELRRAQVELDAARARYFDLYDLAPVGYCTISEKGLILEANLTAATLLGLARAEMVTQPLTRFIAREDQDIYYHHRKQLFGTGEPQTCDLRMAKTDGTVRWINLAATVARDADGTPACRLIVKDITDRKRAEEELQRSNARLDEQFAELSQIYEHSPVGLCVLDRDLRYSRINDRLAEMNGIPVQDHLGRTVREVVPQLAELLEKIWLPMFKTGEPILDVEVEGETPKEPGVTRYWLASFIPLKSATGTVTGLLLAAFEITDRKRAEQALRASEKTHFDQMRRLAKDADKRLEDERAKISRHLHDGVGQALTSLMMRLAWIEKHVRTSDPSLGEEAQQACEHASQIIKDVRNIARSLRPVAIEHAGLIPAVQSYINEFQRLSGINCRVAVRPLDRQGTARDGSLQDYPRGHDERHATRPGLSVRH